MEISAFRPGKYFSFEGEYPLWGTRVSVGIGLGNSVVDKNQQLADSLPAIEERLTWLESNRPTIEKALLDDGMVSLAEDWASSAEEAEDALGCYVMEDGQKVCLPITSQDFCRSLSVSSLGMYCEDGKEDIMMDVFLVCSPDYFAGHSINITIKADGSVKNNSLCG